MLIKALSDYYDIIVERSENIKKGYSEVGIHYLIALGKNGEIADVISHQYSEVKLINGKEKQQLRPTDEVLPMRTEKTAVESNIVEHRPLYIFGLQVSSGCLCVKGKKDADKAHEVFVQSNLAFIEGLSSPIVDAYRIFLQTYMPEDNANNVKLTSIIKGFDTYRFAFCLEGRPDILLHRDPQLCERWSQHYDNTSPDSVVGQCAVTGKVQSMCRLHAKIKGFYSSGSVLVGYNDAAFESYGKEQSYNSSISNEAMLRYTGSLNYLLKRQTNKCTVDGTTIVFFAMNKDTSSERLMGKVLFNINDDCEDGMDIFATEQLLKKLTDNIHQGLISGQQLDVLDKLDKDVQFYIVGLRPNESRLAVQFVHSQKLGDMLCNVAMHQHDLQLYQDSKPISIWQIANQLKSPTSKTDVVNVSMMSSLLQSIVYGYDYPVAMLSTVIRRIKFDSNSDKDKHRKINSIRISLLKAYVNRKLRRQNKEELITMALNETNTDTAYLCGRLFALLEKLQLEAAGEHELNRTIKDSHFASACAQPSVVFSNLIKLAQHHLPKAKHGKSINYEIGMVMAMLDNKFPSYLTLEEQGKFAIGYYQQFYKKYEKKQNTEEVTNNDN